MGEPMIPGLPVIYDLRQEADGKDYGIIEKVHDDGTVTVRFGRGRRRVSRDLLLINTTSYDHKKILRKHGLWWEDRE